MRILILSASVGAGHMRAAEAVEAALREAAPEAAIANYDVLSLMPKAFGRLYRDAYLEMVDGRRNCWAGSTTLPTSHFGKRPCDGSSSRQARSVCSRSCGTSTLTSPSAHTSCPPRSSINSDAARAS